jgi:hypothetical protein
MVIWPCALELANLLLGGPQNARQHDALFRPYLGRAARQ